jgi:hypothetical protein
MKKSVSILYLVAALVACGRSETGENKTSQPATDQANAVGSDSAATASAKPLNCKSMVDASKLGKSDVYQESGKDLKVTLTLAQDNSSSTPGPDGCYFNNSVEVQATRKSGRSVFKRTLFKDDLTYFTKSDETDVAIGKAVLQGVAYNPTFNGQKYVSLVMRLRDPATKKNSEFTVYMNYNGEILRVK